MVFCLVSIIASSAQTTNDTPSWWKPTFTINSVVANKYLAFGSGAVLYDKPVVQSDLFVSMENGLYIDLWNSKSFEGSWGGNLGDEVDYGLGWAGSIGKGFGMDIGTTYFDEPTIFTLGSGDILYSHVKVSRAFKPFAKFEPIVPFVSFENYSTMPDTGFQGGNLYSIGFSTCIPLSRIFKITSTTIASYDDGGFGLRSGIILRQNVELNAQVSKRIRLIIPRLAGYLPTMVDKREPQLVISGGASFTF